MTQPPCPRTWEVEAARDGRLTGDALAQFELHVTDCVQCARERTFIERLGERLRETAPGDDDDAIVRLRASTLERADAMLSGRSSSVTQLRWMAFAAAALIAVLGIVRFTQHRDVAPPPVASNVEVTAPAGAARWSRVSIDGLDRVTLDDGTISLAVRRKPQDPRVVVRVPDGEIEDVGTIFRVTVRRGHTTEIAVTAGSVVFHRNGGDSVAVVAGAPFVAAFDSTPAPAAAAPSVAATTPSPIPPPPIEVSPKSAGSPAPSVITSAPKPLPSASASATSSPPSDDASEEDSAYLRIVALVREGRTEEARLAAKEYLVRFPNGFRHLEVEKIAKAL